MDTHRFGCCDFWQETRFNFLYYHVHRNRYNLEYKKLEPFFHQSISVNITGRCPRGFLLTGK